MELSKVQKWARTYSYEVREDREGRILVENRWEDAETGEQGSDNVPCEPTLDDAVRAIIMHRVGLRCYREMILAVGEAARMSARLVEV